MDIQQNQKTNGGKRFAGIGNRHIDDQIRYAIKTCSRLIHQKGYVLVSGGARGCDEEFEAFFPEHRKIILRARDATQKAIKMAEDFHPAWHQCNSYARALLGRNAMIIMGEDLKTPADFVLCYCANEERGGTALSLNIARFYKIPVFNLADDTGLDVVKYIED